MAKPAGPTQHTDLETKFDVAEDTVSPSFDGLAAVARVEKLPTQYLEAVYFDTPSNDLAANLVTLRRRTGGNDAGWHLKLPAGAARTEIRSPLGTDPGSVPDDLLDVVRAIVRDRPLAPVAQLSTIRDVTMLYGPENTPLAEFCDDRVTARRTDPADGSTAAEMGWREWELELVDGAGGDPGGVLTRLANRLFDAGAEPAGHGSKLARALGDTVPERPEPPAEIGRAHV